MMSQLSLVISQRVLKVLLSVPAAAIVSAAGTSLAATSAESVSTADGDRVNVMADIPSGAPSAPLGAPLMLAQRVNNDVPSVAQPAGLIPLDQLSTLDRVDVYRSGYTGGALVLPSAGQLTSVSELTDVQQSDWAYQALQSLVERYGVIVGYPDSTFRGNRPLSRYEFAAALNTALDRVNELIAVGVADAAKKADLEQLRTELEELKATIDGIAVGLDEQRLRINDLEAKQFSTNTKLNAEVIFSLAGIGGGNSVDGSARVPVPNGTPINQNTGLLGNSTILADRVRLNFDTSFTGKDRLRTRLQAQNIAVFQAATAANTNMAKLGFDGVSSGTNANNTVELDTLQYRFPAFGDRGRVTIDANVGRLEDVFNTLSPFSSGGTGALSRFGRFNPIYRLQSGPGLTVEYNLSPEFNVTAAYMTTTASAANPAPGAGIFGGNYTILGQLTYQPSREFGIAALYARSYFTGGGLAGTTGSVFSNDPFGGGRSTADNYAVQAQFRVSPQFIIAGWAGFQSESLVGPQATFGNRIGQRAESFNWAVQLAFPDLFGRGNLAGIIVGQQPYLTSSTFTAGNAGAAFNTPARRDGTSNFHVEGFYRYAWTDNISITPGLIWIFNPENNGNNSSIFVGTIRTTFTF